MFYTFYSFKGGVGRSMSVANIAELIYRRGLKVLMVDFDLEAPGLEGFFETAADLCESRGVVDMVLSYKMLRTLSRARPDFQSLSTQAEFTRSVEPLTNFITPIYEDSTAGSGLYLMTAGRRPKNDYGQFAESVRKLDWDDFYLNWDGEQFFNWFRTEAATYFDVVLVDSRTGITEMTGICTYNLADVVVMLVAPNRQNLEGARLIANGLQKRQAERRQNDDRQLEFLCVPSRVDISESASGAAFKEQFLKDTAQFADTRLKFENNPFDDLKIPYIPRYAYYEKVAVREPDQPVAADLIVAYNRLLAAMVEMADKSSRFYRRYYSKGRSGSSLTEAAWLPKPSTDFVGRAWVFQSLDRWLKAGSPSTFVLTGEPGSGKTAISYRLVQISRGEVSNEGLEHIIPGILAFAHFCTAADVQSLDPVRFVTSLSLALANRYSGYATLLAHLNESDTKIDLRQSIGTASAGSQVVGVVIESIQLTHQDMTRAFTQLVIEPLERLYAEAFAESIVILIDGLDQANFFPAQSNLVVLIAQAVRRLPPKVRLILTTRRDPRVMTELPAATTLDLVVGRPEAAEDLSAYALKRLEAYPRPEKQDLVRQIVQAGQGNFLYAELALDDVLRSGKLETATMPLGIGGIYVDFVRREIGSDTKRWVDRDGLLLGVIAASFGHGLGSTLLTNIIGRSQSEIASMLRPWAQYLVGSWPDGPFQLFHASYREFLLTNTEYPISTVEAHRAIADALIKEYGGDWKKCEDDYALRYTARHLHDALNAAPSKETRAALEEKMLALLADADFLQSKARRVGLEAVAEDLEIAPATDAILGNLGLVYYRLGKSGKASDSYQKALQIARQRGDRIAENALLGNLGLAFESAGKLTEAIECYQHALNLSSELEDRHSEGSNLGNLGLAYFSLKDIQRAIDHFRQALQIARELGERESEGIWLGNLGNSYSVLGDPKRAIEYYTQALAISEQTGDLQGSGMQLKNLGLAYGAQSEWGKAAEFYTRASEIMEQLGDSRGKAEVLLNLGSVYASQGDMNRALTLHQQALKDMERVADNLGLAQTLGNIGLLYERQQRWQEATEFYNKSLAKMEQISDARGTAQVLINLGNIAASQGDLAHALEHYQRALAIPEMTDAPVETTAQVWNNIGIIFRRQGLLDQAVTSYSRSLEIVKDGRSRKIEADVLRNLANTYRDLGQFEKAVSYYEKALLTFHELGDRDNERAVSEILATARGHPGQGEFAQSGDILVGADKIFVGEISGSTAVAVGRGASAVVGRTIGKSELERLLSPLKDVINEAEPNIRQEALLVAENLKTQLARGEKADDSALAKSIDELIAFVPLAANAVLKLLTVPTVANIVGPVARYVVQTRTEQVTKYGKTRPSEQEVQKLGEARAEWEIQRSQIEERIRKVRAERATLENEQLRNARDVAEAANRRHSVRAIAFATVMYAFVVVVFETVIVSINHRQEVLKTSLSNWYGERRKNLSLPLDHPEKERFLLMPEWTPDGVPSYQAIGFDSKEYATNYYTPQYKVQEGVSGINARIKNLTRESQALLPKDSPILNEDLLSYLAFVERFNNLQIWRNVIWYWSFHNLGDI